MQLRADLVPFSCLALVPAAACSGPDGTSSVKVVSMENASIPGYNRVPMNDYPRIAVSEQHRTVSIVWNAARYRPLGDILLRSWHLGAALTAVQSTPIVIDSKGADHFIPARESPALTAISSSAGTNARQEAARRPVMWLR